MMLSLSISSAWRAKGRAWINGAGERKSVIWASVKRTQVEYTGRPFEASRQLSLTGIFTAKTVLLGKLILRKTRYYAGRASIDCDFIVFRERIALSWNLGDSLFAIEQSRVKRSCYDR